MVFDPGLSGKRTRKRAYSLKIAKTINAEVDETFVRMAA